LRPPRNPAADLSCRPCSGIAIHGPSLVSFHFVAWLVRLGYRNMQACFCIARLLCHSRHRAGISLCSYLISMLFAFLCLYVCFAEIRAVMRTCNICSLNIPAWHIDKKSIKISKMYGFPVQTNCSLGYGQAMSRALGLERIRSWKTKKRRSGGWVPSLRPSGACCSWCWAARWLSSVPKSGSCR